MEAQLREVIGEVLRNRHGYGLMEGRIKPVHIANALLREEHQRVGRMGDLKHLMAATASRETPERRLEAVRRMLERNRERWGRLGEETDLRRSLLMTRVLPLLRTILASDGATFGKSPEFSSFSSPTALTVTRDPSDEQAGAFVHQLWSVPTRLGVLDILREITNPDTELSRVDDLTAVLVPLAEGGAPWRPSDERVRHVSAVVSEMERRLRDAAEDLASYERSVLPNPIASLQRIVLLASISVFFHAASRAHEHGALPMRVMLVDASSSRTSTIAVTSEKSVSAIFEDAREYMARILAEQLSEVSKGWTENPEGAVAELFRSRLARTRVAPNLKDVVDAVEELREGEGDVGVELPRRLVGLLDSSGGRSLDGYIRLLGLRCGLLYPQQKNPQKRLVPMDRSLEVLVAATFNLAGHPVEYRDFLDAMYRRWGLVVGGRLEDARILADSGTPVPSADLLENSERFLTRIEGLGLARKMADSVAVVGLMENSYGSS